MKRTTLKKGNNYKGLKHNVSLKKTNLKKQSESSRIKWIEAREKCLSRDNYRCVICGRIATQVHHIHLRSKRKDLLYCINNLVSLCDRCHFHHGSEDYDKQTILIAKKFNMTVEELLRYAES